MMKTTLAAGLGLLTALAASTGAYADAGSPINVRSPVDARSPVDSGGGWGGGGSNYLSCAETRVHDSYRLTVCNNGRYTVRGAGLNCSGSFSWNNSWGNVRINLRRSECGYGTAWSGDTIRCGGAGWGGFGLADKISRADCMYFPTREAHAEGYRPERVYFD